MKIGALIIAWKSSKDMKELGPLLTIGNTSIIKSTITTLQQAKVEPIVVVTGKRADELEKHIAKRGVIFLRIDNYEDMEMFEAVSMGINYMKNLCDKILVMPGKIPLFSTNTISKLLQSKASAAYPVYEGEKGHPVIFETRFINEILKYKGEHGLSGAISTLIENVELVNVEDESVIMAADSKENYEKIKEKAFNEKSSLRYLLQLRIAKDEIFFGPGIAQFLSLVKNNGSMQTSCKQMNMSYSKGLKMLNVAEKELGVALLLRQSGGANGGSSCLSDTGEDILRRYFEMESKLKEKAEELFTEYFDGLEEL
ncbi:NTP transferase domain-containing protein [Clostridium gasigenes]|uniref:NTP transferase domain-containing protein n=1 Tax=Clostridium gasigenes TaxID=94869 RepID=UPI00143845A4|nr:NTP transferase domain-containing protein [Clostridium gasigenes]NKF05642.1 NTP transferase domain-containing protein [Clostridium gasigenes]QSW19081.1 NTP transferase domain-containing protein [Clostridium gasigenes]